MALLTLTVNDQTPANDKRYQEVAFIQRALNLAAQDIRANQGTKASGNIIGDGGVVLGSWTYTAQAAS